MKMRKLGIVMALICAMSLSGCGTILKNVQHSESAGQTSDTPSNSSSVSEDTDAETYYIGETVNIDDWEITVNSVEIADKINNKTYGTVTTYFSPEEGSKYVVFSISVKNTGTEVSTFLPSFSVGDTVTTKVEYKEYSFKSTNLLGHSDDLHMTSLNPLSSKTGIVAFEIADEVINDFDEIRLVFSTKNEIRVFVPEKEQIEAES
ncbi:MAG: DUF4352 domain-containing protein [Oscillospiraceae bacterium]|nr:DUF4352 domain-containing protein [Oscillospiraceae bacterium]